MRHDEFERLFSTHAEPLFGFLASRTGDRVLAEDLLADTFERVLRARRPFDRRKASEKTWVYTIALNCLRDHVRRKGAEQRALEHVTAEAPDSPSAGTDAAEDRDAVNRALSVLSDEEREAIALRYGADLTLPEIAKVAKLSLTTVEGRVYRALKKLRAELD